MYAPGEVDGREPLRVDGAVVGAEEEQHLQRAPQSAAMGAMRRDAARLGAIRLQR
jgi:hypothetical protein